MLGDYFNKPQQGTRMRKSRASILNLSQDPTLVSQECVETFSTKKLAKLAITESASTNHCGCNHVLEHDTSLPNVIVRRKAASYLMAAKGLRNRVIDEVNRLDHFFQLT